MPLDHYFLYVLVSLAYIASPGPAVFITINGGAAVGMKRTAVLLLGNTIGLGILAFISALGIGVLILSSAKLTIAVKILGALWLAYLGIKMMRAPTVSESADNQNYLRKIYASTGWFSKFRDGLVLALTNPKPIVFFTSIYPQFVSADGFTAYQLSLLGVTFMLLSFAVLNFYSAISAILAGQLLDEKKVRVVNCFFGGILILLALLLLLELTS